VAGQVTLEYFMRKAAEGWKLAAVEWVRDVAEEVLAPPLTAGLATEEPPYGFRVSTAGETLEEHPLETMVLLLILEQIVREKRLSEIAEDLNVAGYSTRRGAKWTAASVFELLPRLIDAGPSLLKSAQWQHRREEISGILRQAPVQ